MDKKHAYEAKVREVELGCFPPLVFSTSGGLGSAAKTCCKSRIYNSLTGIRTDHIHNNIHYISRVCAGSSAHALIILHYSLSNV